MLDGKVFSPYSPPPSFPMPMALKLAIAMLAGTDNGVRITYSLLGHHNQLNYSFYNCFHVSDNLVGCEHHQSIHRYRI